MRQRHTPPAFGITARALVFLACTCLLTSICIFSAGAQEGDSAADISSKDIRPDASRPGLTSPIERILKQAEQALEKQEPQLAESLYRDSLRECWLLMSLLETSSGDPIAAHDALELATHSAVPTDSQVPVGTLIDLSEVEQNELRARLEATLALVYRNLGVLAEESRRPHQAATLFTQADALGPAVGRSADKVGPGSLVLGSLDLRWSPARDLVTADTAFGALPPDEQLTAASAAEIAAEIAATPAADLNDDKIAAQKVSHLHQKLARLHLARGHDEMAAAELRTADGLGELDLGLGLKLADLEVAAGNSAAARRVLQVLTTKHSSPRALLKLAELTWPTGPPKSLPILLQAQALAPNSEEILGNTANAYLAVDEPEKALETLVSLMTLSPDVVLYVRLLGEAYTKLGRLEEAVTVLREAIALEPSYMRSRIHLAGVLLHMKRFDEAEAELREILAVDPERPEAKDLLEFMEKARGSPRQSEPGQDP